MLFLVGHDFVLATDFDFRFGANPKLQTLTALQQAHEFIAGAGFIVFPEKRIQFMNEYTGIPA